MSKLFPQIDLPELFLGFVSPIGTPTDRALQDFEKFFRANDYRVHKIKVTDVFSRLKPFVAANPEHPLVSAPYFDRYKSHILYGNKVREKLEDDAILAGLSIQQVVEIRNSLSVPAGENFQKNAFLIHQFKRPEEIDLLRSVYGRLFYQISIYSDRAARVDFLCRKMASSENDGDHLKFESEATKLVQTDEDESNVSHGQRVGEIFHNADIIVKLDQDNSAPDYQINRFCEVLFSSNKFTPSRVEHGMFMARAAALRTADLSRQVGAAIFSPDGELISIGCNEVPKAKGGTYWPEDGNLDDREFNRGIDSNDVRKQELLKEVLIALGISELSASTTEKLKRLSLMDALEYGRIVHAEMNAIVDAARTHSSLKGATLFCTTFPCHMCAKHIVASGIEQVYFLEPYPKSLVALLHSDSIEVEGKGRGQYKKFGAVKFTHFHGITPRRYDMLFARRKRKDEDGKFQEYIRGHKKPVMEIKLPVYAQLETYVLEHVKAKARS